MPPALRRYSDDSGEFLFDATTVKDALAALFDRFPALETRVLSARGEVHPHLLLFVDEQQATLTTPLGPDAVLEIVAAAEGG